jgi:hypothetical protein
MIGASRLAVLAGHLDALAMRDENAELKASVGDLAATIRATREAVGKIKLENASA